MSLSTLRAQIEKVDARIVRLLNERTALSIRIGQTKRAAKSEFFSPEREKELLRRLVRLNGDLGGPLGKADLREIYREIFSRSRARQKPLTVGYAGGTAALAAALRRFGSGEKFVPLGGSRALADALRRGKIHAGIAATVPPGLRDCGKVDGPYRLVVADGKETR